jgi:hypothetical protein
MNPAATKTTLDPTAAALAEEVAAAREALVDLCMSSPERSWPAYELKRAARNGWSAGAMTLALNRLLSEGVLRADGDLVHLTG